MTTRIRRPGIRGPSASPGSPPGAAHRARSILVYLFIQTTAALVILTGCERQSTPQPEPGSSRPPLANRVDIQNVILISIDTLRADHLGCYGHEYVKTPNIDAFAAEAMLFATHINAAPSTLSSHTALMTGTYPHTHGVPKNGHVVNDANIMLAEVLREAGFMTAGFAGAFPLDPVVGFAQGFDHYDAEFDDLKTRLVRDQTQRRGDKVTNAVLKWLNGHHAKGGDAGRLFLFAHYFDAHWPYEAPPPFGRMYRTDKSPQSGSMETVVRIRIHLEIEGYPGFLELGLDLGDVIRRRVLVLGAEIAHHGNFNLVRQVDGRRAISKWSEDAAAVVNRRRAKARTTGGGQIGNSATDAVAHDAYFLAPSPGIFVLDIVDGHVDVLD